MRSLSYLCVALIGIVAAAVVFYSRTINAQEAPPAPVVATVVPEPSAVIEQMMGLIGQNRIDDAIGMMEGLKDQAEARNTARDELIHLRDQTGVYRGYDIAAIQRFTPQFQTVDVMAYYDLQPVLLRFHFYRPQLTGPWNVLGFQETTVMREIVEILRDTPVDYVARHATK